MNEVLHLHFISIVILANELEQEPSQRAHDSPKMSDHILRGSRHDHMTTDKHERLRLMSAGYASCPVLHQLDLI